MSTRGEPRAEWSLLHVDERVAVVAERQRGTITYVQLRKCGLTRRDIDGRVASGRLHRLHRGVYVVGHRVLAPFARETAALLACSPKATLTFESAAIAWDLPVLTDAVHVTVDPERRPRHAGIRVHRQRLQPHEVTRRHGLPVTTPLRTIQDIAATTGDLERVIAEARANHLIRLEDLHAIPGRRGAASLARALDRGPQWTRSHAERVLLDLVRRAGLPAPEFNADVIGYKVDAVWRGQRVAVEVDSWAWHGHRRAFEQDRARDMRLREAGFTPVRVTARQLDQEPLRTVAHLARLVR